MKLKELLTDLANAIDTLRAHATSLAAHEHEAFDALVLKVRGFDPVHAFEEVFDENRRRMEAEDDSEPADIEQPAPEAEQTPGIDVQEATAATFTTAAADVPPVGDTTISADPVPQEAAQADTDTPATDTAAEALEAAPGAAAEPEDATDESAAS